MKDVLYNKSFVRQYTKLPVKIQKKFKERVAMFKKNPRDPLLKTHKLHGKKRMFWSINITGDYRAQFLWKGDVAIFYQIGTHSELY